MKFAEPLYLFGTLGALVVALLLVVGGVRLVRARARFGDVERVRALVTAEAARRRAWKGVALVLATALAFVALARPQYGRGTRLVPATNLDVVIVLDFSKSMYARDVVPSRTARAKAEVARLIRDLAGARFGAVAFAGEPIGFPLTSDGAAIAQFLRQFEPNDMPVGGTAIARALERARELFARDPKSKDHKKVILLVTDGEDLEGDPVEVARAAAAEATRIDVVQIGGRTPEPVPDVGPDGRVVGIRRDEEGRPLTTALSAEGEAQLAEIAKPGGGQIVRAERGSTGIDTIARDLRRMQTEELAERVETVYADVYAYPLALALLLLLLETFLSDAPRRRVGAVGLLFVVGLAGGGTTACDFHPSRPFERNAPDVDRALAALDAGDAQAAASWLEGYLDTGACVDGGLGVPERVRERPNASFDLGLGLFRLGEQFGKRFGDEESYGDAGPTPEEQRLLELRAEQVECARRVLDAIAADASLEVAMRARAHYLSGNLDFLRRQYEAAVASYDKTLALVPGLGGDAGDTVGRDAAWNRAIALRRIEDEKNRKDAGSDGSNDAPSDAPSDGPGEGGDSGSPDGGGPPDSGHDDRDAGGGGPDGGQDAGQEAGGGQDAGGPEAGGAQPPPPQPSGANQDDRILDMLEQSPTLQQQDAKNRAAGRRFRGAADK